MSHKKDARLVWVKDLSDHDLHCLPHFIIFYVHVHASISLYKRTSDTLIGYLPIFQMLPKTSLHIRDHWYLFE